MNIIRIRISKVTDRITKGIKSSRLTYERPSFSLENIDILNSLSQVKIYTIYIRTKIEYKGCTHLVILTESLGSSTLKVSSVKLIMVDTIGGRVVEFSIPDISTRFGSVKFSTELTIVDRIVEL